MNEELPYRLLQPHAKLLYTEHDKSIADIALQLEIDEAIVRQWIATDGWDAIKTSFAISRKNQLAILYDQLYKISNKLKSQEEPNAKDTDLYSKYTASIRNLEFEPNISNVLEVFEMFALWLRKKDLALTKKLILHLDAFVKHKLVS
jgi:Phage terminase small subunit